MFSNTPDPGLSRLPGGKRGKRVRLCGGTGEEVPVFKEAAMMYVQEVVSHLEGVLGRPVDEYSPPVPPWS
jgi:hypothetical protein